LNSNVCWTASLGFRFDARTRTRGGHMPTVKRIQFSVDISAPVPEV
jgi:hypothetical protein